MRTARRWRDRASAGPAQRSFTLAMLCAPVAMFAWAGWSRRWMSDDGYIYLRVVRQLLAGNGPVFNRGERVEATTSPLWLAMLSAMKGAAPPVSLPWLAVIAGLILSVAGLALAQWGSYELWRRKPGQVILPLGSLVVIALPPFWDFATSGLETGLSLAWLGASFWALVRSFRSIERSGVADERHRRRASAPLLVLIGLGPLVRPDLAIFAGAFLAAALILWPAGSWRGRFRDVAIALAVPATYQVFRMGYYGSLVPNPAFAKEASVADWSRGWSYLVDTVRPYWLPLPLVLVAGAALPWTIALHDRDDRSERRRLAALVLAPTCAAVAHGLYIVYMGGDFMHARLLLPDVFALAMPMSVVVIESRLQLGAVAVLAIWAIICAAALRPPYSGERASLAALEGGVTDERAYYAWVTHNDHPITPDDYRPEVVAGIAFSLEQQPPDGDLVLQSTFQMPLRRGADASPVVQVAQIGVFGYILGPAFRVEDVLGLAEPVGGRLSLEGHRGRPGHEKMLPEAWVVARFADPAASTPAGRPTPSDVAAARAALACGDARRLVRAATDPLTPKRFALNIVDAFRLYRLRIPPQPQQARNALCGPAAPG